MDVESLAKQLILKGMTEEQQKAILDSIKTTMTQARTLQKQRVGENVQVVVQALKKLEADIRSRYDEVGNKIEKRVATIKDGKDGLNGANGKDGKDGRPGRDGGQGPRGVDGLNGNDGRDGEDGVSVTDAHIDFDGSLVISLSSGRTINVGEVVAPDLAEKIKVITNGGGTSQGVLDALASLQTQIDNVSGGLSYQGTWNATTNTPTLASSVGVNGYYYITATAGSTNLDGITDWQIGDWLLFNGTVWQKIDQSNTVTSVNGQTGAVSLTTTNIAEGTNQYFTDARARAALSAGTGISYSSSTGVVTNAAPDQVVVLTGAGSTSVTGTYPNFTITSSSGASGDVTGPASATDGALVAFDGTTGKLIKQAATVTIAQGGTGETTRQAAMDALAGSTTSGQYLRGDGTDVVMSAIQAADVPTLNQSTTGNAATATVLQTSRTINGVGFDGSANITVADATKLPLAGGTMTGAITFVGGQTFPGTGDVTLTGTQTLTNKTLTSPVVTQNIQVISTNTTAVASRTYVFTATLTLTLPSSPTAGDMVMFANRSATDTPVIDRNGQNIMGLAENMTVDNVNYFATLVFADATRGWIFQ